MKDIIYHYTDIKALQNILSSCTLWMTSHQFLNDSQEIIDGYNRLKNSIDMCMSKYDKSFHESTKNVVAEMLELVDKTIVLSTSFSKNDDLLSQWRSYCPAEGGYSIGFDRAVLDQLKGHSEFSPRLFECIYDEAEKDRLAKTFSEELILGFDRNDEF